MEYGLGKLEEMSRMEYGAANKDELVDIETVHIDPDLPPRHWDWERNAKLFGNVYSVF